MAEYVFLNDQLVTSDKALVSIHDTGLLHGVGLFETLRSYQGNIFALGDHLDRMFASAERLNISISQSRDEIADAAAGLLQANNLTDARLRITITPGNLNRHDSDHPCGTTMFITAVELTGYPPQMYKHGMTVIISSFKQNPDDPTAGHKTLNYFPRLLALQQAQQKKTGEAIWFTTTNRLAEACISNIFIVKDNVLLTPPLDTPVLPGITRQKVIELARNNEIPCHEKPIVIKDLLDAAEVFLTNSIMELMPVCHIEAHKVGNEQPGPVYQKLHQLYRQLTTAGV